jgi:hypothetical protein
MKHKLLAHLDRSQIINKSVVFLNFESFNTAHQKKAFHSIINEKKDVFVNLTTSAGNHLFITPLPKLFDVIFAYKYLIKL